MSAPRRVTMPHIAKNRTLRVKFAAFPSGAIGRGLMEAEYGRSAAKPSAETKKQTPSPARLTTIGFVLAAWVINPA